MADKSEWKTPSIWKAKGRAMDISTGESPGHLSQSQYLGNSPSEEEMGHWTPTGIEPTNYDDDDISNIIEAVALTIDMPHFFSCTILYSACLTLSYFALSLPL